MLDRFFPDSRVVECLRRGVLGDALDDVAARLYERGHSAAVARSYLSIAGHFSHWLCLEGIPPAALEPKLTEQFREEHLPMCQCAVPRGMRTHVRAALAHVLVVLSTRGWLVPSSVPVQSAVDKVLCAFDTYLKDTCGAAPATRRLYIRYARSFLERQFGKGEVDLRSLSAKELIDFVSEQTRERTPETAKVVRTALRSFLRFGHVDGLCDGALANAVLRVARWRRARLPCSLSAEQLAALLAAFDCTTAIGRRDYAMTLCLAHMGLRAGEVAALSLDDIDWRAGTLQVARGKERRASILPLPVSVGRALSSYLHSGRPCTRLRQIFVLHHAPVGAALASSGVSAVVRRAFARARIQVPSRGRGAHVLRHTAATRMVCSGASIKEVADILRHRCLETAMIYTKLDTPTLAEVAQPWPEVQS